MTDGRWSVGIMCSAEGDEDVILYDGQPVPIEDVVAALNRAEHLEAMLRRASKYMRSKVLGGKSQVAAEFLRDIYQEVGPPRAEDLRKLDELLAKLKGIES